MADFNLPLISSLYTDFLNFLKARDEDVAKWFDGTTETNVPIGTKRWNAAGMTFERWDGAAWAALTALYNIKASNAGTADTVGGYGPSSLRNDLLIPSGTRMVFYQAAAPFGWTQVTTQNDKALRVVSTTGGGTGGTHPLSTPPATTHSHTGPSHVHAGPSHSHNYAQVINHTHTVNITDPGHYHTSPNGLIAATGGAHQFAGAGGDGSTPRSTMNTDTKAAGISASTIYPAGGVTTGTTGASGTGNTGAAGNSATSSNGPTAFSPQYVDVIICARN